MSNLVTLTQDEINRFEIKDNVVGDVITAEEYSALVKKAEKTGDKKEDSEEKTAKKAK